MQFNRFETTVDLAVPTFDEAPPAVRDYIWNYGWRQSLQDSYAQAKNANEFDGKLKARFDKIMSGKMEVSAGNKPRLSPIEREIMRLAFEKVVAICESKKIKLAKAKMEAHAETYAQRFREELLPAAQENLDRQAALTIGDDAIFAELFATPTPEETPKKNKK